MKMYNTEEAAKFLGLMPQTIQAYACSGCLQAQKIHGAWQFEATHLEQYDKNHVRKIGSGKKKLSSDEWARRFDERYGEGAYERLLKDFQIPCIDYQETADKHGVEREAVRKWHDRILPEGAKTGHERRHVCAIGRWKKELFENELFSAFYRDARKFFQPEDIETILTSGSFRTRAVKLKGKIVALRRGTEVPSLDSHRKTYHLRVPQEQADYAYYLLRKGFLFVPRNEMPQTMATFVDNKTWKYYRFRDNFDAIFAEKS
ncbi:MAG: helix-turn-helix domain-containing protein [Candidatus Aenigmarchaeota archaeon]|nr:helix-turn-helix domain-containing protein [Candidatus Aenigmarchaeota archaeon]